MDGENTDIYKPKRGPQRNQTYQQFYLRILAPTIVLK